MQPRAGLGMLRVRPKAGVPVHRGARPQAPRRARPPLDLPLEQARILSHIPEAGITAARLAHELELAPETLEGTCRTLLRRHLLRRQPARKGEEERLVLGARGRVATAWLQRLQVSLPASRFDPGAVLASPPPRPGRLEVNGQELPWATDPAALAGSDETRFDRGLLLVAVATALFVALAIAGAVSQREGLALTLLGVGGAVAIVCLGLAVTVLVRRRPRNPGRGRSDLSELHQARQRRQGV